MTKNVAEKNTDTLPPATTGAGKLRALDAPLSERFERFDMDGMLKQKPGPVPWILEPVLARGMLTLVAGREGEGKSLLAQAIACGVASGTPVAGLQPSVGPHAGARPRVLVIDAENGLPEVHRRVHALGMGGALGTDGTSPQRLTIMEAAGFDLRADMSELRRVMMVERPSLLVLDSLQSMYSGNEYGIAVSKVLDNLRLLLREFDCAGLLLHHSVKSRTLRIVRGGTKLLSRPELIYFWGRHPDDSEKGRRMLECQKNRAGGEPDIRWVKIGTEGGFLVVDECEPFVSVDTPAPERPVRDVLMNATYWTVKLHGPINRTQIATMLERDPKDRSIGRCLDEHVRTGAMVRTGHNYKVVQEA